MAWSILQAPGTKHGPCRAACQHIDCALTRGLSQEECPGCKRAIGYDEPYVQPKGEGGPVWHFGCLQDAAEKGQV